MTPFIVYGIKDPKADVFIYVGKSTTGLLRPYAYFHYPEKCHNPALKSWILGLGQERHAPDRFVSIIGHAANGKQLHLLEAQFIQEYAAQYPLLNKTWKVDSDTPPLTVRCDADLVARSAQKLSQFKMTIDEFVTIALIDMLRSTEQVIVPMSTEGELKDNRVPLEILISEHLDWESGQGYWRELTATEILAELGIKKPKQDQKVLASRIIFNMNGRRRRKSNGYTILWCPALKTKLNQ